MTRSSPPPQYAPPPEWIIRAIGTLLLMNVYAPQSLLPLLAQEFGVSVAQVGTLIGSTTLAMALFSPFAGLLSDAFGRRRMVLCAFGLLTVPGVLAGLTHSFVLLNAVRFAQGLLIPLGLVSITAYLADEVAPQHYSRLLTAYVAGTVLGGFLGRFMSGEVAHLGNWHLAFWVLALTNALAFVLVLRLPAERQFQPQRNLQQAALLFGQHLRHRRLALTGAVGFLILFVLVSLFNTITFRLAAAPYSLSAAALGLIFAVYLLGVVVTPATAPLLARGGPVAVLRVAVALSLSGLALTLLRPLPAVVLGLAAASCGVFMAQAAAQAAIQQSVTQARSLANGLYNFAYYSGAALASVVAGLVYQQYGWNGVAAICALALLLVLWFAGLWARQAVSVRAE